MSKAENPVEDVKKLALRCKALEMQLRQSVPRKDHLEITSKLEREIASLEKDLDRSRAEIQKTIAINKQIMGVESQIGAVLRATSGLAKTLDTLDSTTVTTRKALAEQARTIDGIGAKIAQGTVPSGIHLESLSKINNLESKCEELTRHIGTMVPAREYVALNDRFQEANRRISTMVPASDLEEANRRISTMVPASDLEEANRKIASMVLASDFADMKRRADDLEATISTMVPREQLAAAEARVGELEGMLAYRVPQTVYDDLVSRVVSLAEAVTGGAVEPEEARPEAVSEAAAQAIAEPQPEIVEATVAETPVQAVDEPRPEGIAVPEPPVAPAPAPVTIDAQPVEEVSEPSPPVEAGAEVNIEQAILDVTEPTPQADVPPASPVPVGPGEPAPEIREVASQLAEISSQVQEAKGEDTTIGGEAPTEPVAPVAPSAAKDAPAIEAVAEETTAA